MMVKFPEIGAYRNIVQGLKLRYQFVGKDENDDPIYDETRELPTITFKGTVKLHGTNAGIGFQGDDMWFQSRTNIISPEKDNAGFATFFSGAEKIEYLKTLGATLKEKHDIPAEKPMVIFGEWCGGSIQKGVALNELDKRFVIFAIRVISESRNDDGNYTDDNWLPIEGISNSELAIYNISDFKQYELTINLNDPGSVIDKIEELVKEVEDECPFGKAFGVSGRGEGIVWVMFEEDGTRQVFKTKGEKHRQVKQKKAATVDVKKMNSINEFVDYALTEVRLNQAIEQVFTSNSETPSKKGTGVFLKWIVNDIVKEEIDTLSENGLCAKDINGALSKKAREWFFKYLDDLVFGK